MTTRRSPREPAVNDLSHLCGASMASAAQMIGPCLLRFDHDGPVHQGPDEIRWSGSALASTDGLAAAIARVRELHEEIDCECVKCRSRGGGDRVCKECSDGDGASGAVVWPCATIAALDQPETSAIVCSRCHGHPAEREFDVCESCVDEITAINQWAANLDPREEA